MQTRCKARQNAKHKSLGIDHGWTGHSLIRRDLDAQCRERVENWAFKFMNAGRKLLHEITRQVRGGRCKWWEIGIAHPLAHFVKMDRRRRLEMLCVEKRQQTWLIPVESVRVKATGNGQNFKYSSLHNASSLTACSNSSSVALKSDSPKSPPNELRAPRPPLKNAGDSPGKTWCAEEQDSANARLRDSFSAASFERPGMPRP